MVEKNKKQENEKFEEKLKASDDMISRKIPKVEEDKIVEEEIEKVEKGKESVKEAEKEIAKEIAEEVEEDKKDTEEGRLLEKDGDKKDSEEEKKDTEGVKKKEEVKPGAKKTEAVVNGRNLRVSTKHSVAICDFIRGKYIDQAISMLREVVRFKKPIPMKGEIPHRKGIMSGRYPVKATEIFIRLLESLKANALINELELEKFRLYCKANVASRPYKRFGRGRMKRTHATLKLVPITQNKNKPSF